MALGELERRMNEGQKPVSVRYIILNSFKNEVVFMCQITFKTKKMSSWYRITISLKSEHLLIKLCILVILLNYRIKFKIKSKR